MNNQYKCILQTQFDCKYRLPDNKCEGNTSCGFCKTDEKIEPKGYVRQERWYEKYYK